MNLKEAFHYSNRLNLFFEAVLSFLSDSANVTLKEETHYKNHANPDAKDETVDASSERCYTYPVDRIVEFAEELVSEKEKLAQAINRAKQSSDFDLDSQVAINSYRQRAAGVFSGMCELRPREKKLRGSAYKFNVNGDETEYTYEIKQVTTIDFDRKAVKAASRHMAERADFVSSQIDKMIIDTEVNFTPEFNINDTLDDALEQFCEGR